MKNIKLLLIVLIIFIFGCSNTVFNKYEPKPIEEIVETESVEEVKEIVNTVENENKKNKEDLLEIMPNYKKVIYSKAYLLEKNIKKIENSYYQILEEINTGFASEEEKMIEQMNFKQIEIFLQRDYEANIKSYERLEKTDYLEYLKEDGNNYKQKTYVVTGGETTTNLSVEIDLDTMEKKSNYYQFDAIIYKPVKIKKETVLSLEYGDKIMIQYPKLNEETNVIENKNTMMIYDGGMGFSYNDKKREEVIDEKDIDSACYLLPLDDDYYVFYEGDDKKSNLIDKKIKIKILDDANLGVAPSFLSIAREEIKKNKKEEYKIYYEQSNKIFNKYVKDNDNLLLGNKNKFFANYINFDEKGYVVDIYYFGKDV